MGFRRVFMPRKDITAFELATIWNESVDGVYLNDEEFFNKLPPEIQKHWVDPNDMSVIPKKEWEKNDS